ncbi:MAG TPA: glycosyltransferase, partial [bacterium]|nr:glycosyltransferase [bacterium]
AVESAMREDSRIRFLSTGGAIDGHDEATYPEFQRMVDASPFRDRFDLRGWVPSEDLPGIQEQVDLFINVDRFCYETLIGARNRITEMMVRGVPILSTLGTEISRILQENACGLVVPIGDCEALSQRILCAADHPGDLEEMSQRARRLFEEKFTYEATARPLIEWAKTPVRAGDAGKGVALLTAPPPVDPVRGVRAGFRLIREGLIRKLRGDQ